MLNAMVRARIDGGMAVANVTVLALAALGALLVWPSWEATPLVRDLDRETATRLEQMEALLRRHPGDDAVATSVARLWQELGQPGWSYSALLEAERSGPKDPRARLQLAAGYLDIGETDDASRVLDEASLGCPVISCDPTLRFKIDLFREVTDILVREGVHPLSERVFLAQAIQRVIKQVELKPRPTAPADGAPAAPQ